MADVGERHRRNSASSHLQNFRTSKWIPRRASKSGNSSPPLTPVALEDSDRDDPLIDLSLGQLVGANDSSESFKRSYGRVRRASETRMLLQNAVIERTKLLKNSAAQVVAHLGSSREEHASDESVQHRQPTKRKDDPHR